MDKGLHNYLSSGEFARLMRASKETLFHYDDIGVFSPEIRGENDYRYYSVYQIEAFEVIRTLKEIGMPLKDIKGYLENRSPDKLIKLLEQESLSIKKRIAELSEMDKLITKKAELTRSAMNIDFSKITISFKPREFYVLTYLNEPKSERAMMLKVAEHISYMESHEIYSPYTIGEILTLENARLKKYDFSDYLCYYTRIDKKPRRVKIHEKPEGDYLAAYHVGGYINVGDAYERLLEYADKHRLCPDNYIYEDVILDELSTNGYDAYVLRLSVKILNKED